ncbi:putative DNA-directed RNA polymerase beta subunit 2 [Salmonella phage SPFM9]|nr:putative DNA-directed RNA polymerase beta subunit 2 [Salmonella phage SPFM9]
MIFLKQFNQRTDGSFKINPVNNVIKRTTAASTEALEENRKWVSSKNYWFARLGGLGGDYDGDTGSANSPMISFPDRTVKTFVESMAPHPSSSLYLHELEDDWVTLKEKGAYPVTGRGSTYSSTIRLETTTELLYLSGYDIWNDYFSFITRDIEDLPEGRDRKLVRGLSLADPDHYVALIYQDKRSFKIFYIETLINRMEARELRHKPLMIKREFLEVSGRVYDLFTTDDGYLSNIRAGDGNLYGVNTKTLGLYQTLKALLPVAQYHIRERSTGSKVMGREDAIRPTDTRIRRKVTSRKLMNGTRNVLSSFTFNDIWMYFFNIQDGKGGFAIPDRSTRTELTDPVRWKLQQRDQEEEIGGLYRRLISLARASRYVLVLPAGLRDLVIRQDGESMRRDETVDFFNKFRPVSLADTGFNFFLRYYEQLTPGRNFAIWNEKEKDFEPALPSDKGVCLALFQLKQLYEEICSGKREARDSTFSYIDIKLDIISPTTKNFHPEGLYSTEIFGLTGSNKSLVSHLKPVTTTDTFQGLQFRSLKVRKLNWVDFYLLNVVYLNRYHRNRLCLFLP